MKKMTKSGWKWPRETPGTPWILTDLFWNSNFTWHVPEILKFNLIYFNCLPIDNFNSDRDTSIFQNNFARNIIMFFSNRICYLLLISLICYTVYCLYVNVTGFASQRPHRSAMLPRKNGFWYSYSEKLHSLKNSKN